MWKEAMMNESEALACIFLEALRKATEDFAPEKIHNEFLRSTEEAEIVAQLGDYPLFMKIFKYQFEVLIVVFPCMLTIIQLLFQQNAHVFYY
jgi:hypothetical protein